MNSATVINVYITRNIDHPIKSYSPPVLCLLANAHRIAPRIPPGRRNSPPFQPEKMDAFCLTGKSAKLGVVIPDKR